MAMTTSLDLPRLREQLILHERLRLESLHHLRHGLRLESPG